MNRLEQIKKIQYDPTSIDRISEMITIDSYYISLLLEVVEAAKDCEAYYGGDEHSGPIKRLKAALARL